MEEFSKPQHFTHLEKIDSHTKILDPNTIKRMVYAYYEPLHEISEAEPLQRLANAECTLIAPNVDITKAQTAFDRLAIPKLKKDVLNPNLTISRQAVTALLDLVHDPEKAVQAFKLNVLARLVRLMRSPDAYIRHHTLCILRVLAGQPNGPIAIAANKFIIQQLKNTITDSDDLVRLETARTLTLLGLSWFSFQSLIDEGFVIQIIRSLTNENNPDTLIELLNALENILDKSDSAKIEAVKEDACTLLAKFIKNKNPEIRRAVMQVYTQIFITKEGKIAVEECYIDLLTMIKESIEAEDEYVIENIIALGFLFVTTPLKMRGVSIKILDKLVMIAVKSSRPVITKNTMQVLTNFAAAPSIKRELEEIYLQKIRCINTQGDPIIEKFKKRLITVITHKV